MTIANAISGYENKIVRDTKNAVIEATIWAKNTVDAISFTFLPTLCTFLISILVSIG